MTNKTHQRRKKNLILVKPRKRMNVSFLCILMHATNHWRFFLLLIILTQLIDTIYAIHIVNNLSFFSVFLHANSSLFFTFKRKFSKHEWIRMNINDWVTLISERKHFKQSLSDIKCHRPWYSVIPILRAPYKA